MIKILNPNFPNMNETGEGIRLKMYGDDENGMKRQYEMTSELVEEKEGYLKGDDNHSSNSAIDDD